MAKRKPRTPPPPTSKKRTRRRSGVELNMEQSENGETLISVSGPGFLKNHGISLHPNLTQPATGVNELTVDRLEALLKKHGHDFKMEGGVALVSPFGQPGDNEVPDLSRATKFDVKATEIITTYCGAIIDDAGKYALFAVLINYMAIIGRSINRKDAGDAPKDPLIEKLSALSTVQFQHLMDAAELLFRVQCLKMAVKANNISGIIQNAISLGETYSRMTLRELEPAAEVGTRTDRGGRKGRDTQMAARREDWKKWQKFVDDERGYEEGGGCRNKLSHDAACRNAAVKFDVSLTTVKQNVENRTSKKLVK